MLEKIVSKTNLNIDNIMLYKHVLRNQGFIIVFFIWVFITYLDVDCIDQMDHNLFCKRIAKTMPVQLITLRNSKYLQI